MMMRINNDGLTAAITLNYDKFEQACNELI